MSQAAAGPIQLVAERRHLVVKTIHLVAEMVHPVAVTIHTVAAVVHQMVHPMAVAAEVLVAEEMWICTEELMQRNPRWVVSQMDTAGKKPGLVENQTSNIQDWKHPMQSTFHNHLRRNQTAQKPPLVTGSAPKECLSKKHTDSKQEKTSLPEMQWMHEFVGFVATPCGRQNRCLI